MALIVAYKNPDLDKREAAARELWEKVLAPKWDAKLRAEAETFFEKPQGKKFKGKKPAGDEPRDRA